MSFSLFVFYNPYRKKSQQSVVKIVQQWPQAQLITQIQDLSKLQQQNLLVVGGDGTFHTVINHAPHTNIFWFYPSGTGNDFVKNFSPHPLGQLLQLIECKQYVAVGIMQFNHIFGLNSAGMLFQGQAANTASKMWRGWGNLIYIFGALRHLFTYRPQQMQLNAKPCSLLMLSFGNGQYTGGGYKLFPTANPQNQNMVQLAILPINIQQRLEYAVRARIGTHTTMPSVQYSHIKSVQITSSQPQLMDIDGEIYTMPMPLNITYLPAALRIGVLH